VRPKPRTVHVFHGHVFRGHFSSPAGRAFALAEGALAKITDELIAISPSVAADLATFGVDRKARLHTIYIGAELAPFLEAGHEHGALRRELALDPSTFLAVYPARICWVKAQDLTIEALGLARDRIGARPFKLLFVGDGENREALLARARELGVAHQVEFAGYREDMPHIYGDADLVVLASRYEGTPVALMEATAAGRPFLATAVGGVKDLWRPEMGRLVAPEDPQALAAALVEAIEAPPPAVPDALRREVVARFSVARFAGEVEALLERTVRGG
jgi:glycosyltransferase involved in cell wall biosynthesis